MLRVFVRFLEDIEDTKETFQNSDLWKKIHMFDPERVSLLYSKLT